MDQARTLGRIADRQVGRKTRQRRLSRGDKSLTRLLERRFGPLSGFVHERIAVAGPWQVEAWLEAVLDAPDLEAVFTVATRH